MAQVAVHYENIWLDKPKYHDAEVAFYAQTAQAVKTPLANKVASVRKQLKEMRNQIPDFSKPTDSLLQHVASVDSNASKFFEKKIVEFEKTLTHMEKYLGTIETRLQALEKIVKPVPEQNSTNKTNLNKTDSQKKEEEDDVDLFGSDSEEESEEAAKIREERLAAYNAKKSKKPQVIAKSNIILDIKPWDDETDMKKLEEEVRKIKTDGLVWGAAKLVPLAYGIHKLQISCVVEDEKVSLDWLQEEIENISDFVQSIDVAAFNKV